MSPPRRHRTSGDDSEAGRTSASRRAKRARTEAEDSEDFAARGKTRMRVTRACNECRKRKDRCDGGRPACQPCLDAGRSCSYNPPKKRGLRTGYVRALEVLLGMIFSSIDQSDAWLSSLFEGEACKPAFTLSSPGLVIHSGVDACEVFVEFWRKTEVSKKVEQWLSHEDSVEGDVEAEAGKDLDTRISEAASLLKTIRKQGASTMSNNLDSKNGHDFYRSRSDCGYDGTDTRMYRLPRDTDGVDKRASATADRSSAFNKPTKHIEEPPQPRSFFRLPPNWSFLLEIYFASTHSWLPMFQKHDILRLPYMLKNGQGTTDVVDSISHGDRCSLWAVLAYSSHQLAGDDSEERSKLLHVQTTKLLAEEPDKYELGHVRAFLTLTLLYIAKGNHVGAWLSVGRATHIATSILPVQEITSTTRAHVDEGARRAISCCFVLDTLVASWIGTRPYFKRSDMTKLGPLLTDSMEEWEPWQSPEAQSNVFAPRHIPGHVISTFNQFVQVVVFLNDHIRLRSEDGAMARLQELGRALGNWCQQNHPACEVEAPPQMLNLHMASIGVFEAVRAEQLRLTGVQNGFDVAEGSSRMHEQGRLLDHRVRTMGVFSVPPTTSVYLSWFDSALCLQIRLYDHPRVRVDLQALRNSLLDLSKSHLQARNRVGGSHATRTTSRLAPVSEPGLMTRQFSQPRKNDFQRGMPTPASSGVSVQSRESDPAGYHQLESNLIANAVRRATPSQNELFRSHPAVLAASEPSMMNGAAGFDQLVNATSAELGDNELFHSLASLESADWSANPPEFLEHLGILRDGGPDIHSFFNQQAG
ncbi:Quinic acid utilization activator [Colletotrichum sidae]|uniref:Quinic acid utilization activator n=1 Tax=Colletotrichum sidae TaxID=1347389 RepID=A0A4R8THD3_9PEZI|nr:Quinic acid utilization activator [Colletotrichum sidae]